MLSKDKTILKARLILAIEKDDLNDFRKWSEKIEAVYDKFEWIEGLMGPLDVLFRKIESKENSNKYLFILSEEVSDFYYQIFLFNYHFNKDINKSLNIIDDLIKNEERKMVKHMLMKNKLETLLNYQAPDFIKEKINEEIGLLLEKLDNF